MIGFIGPVALADDLVRGQTISKDPLETNYSRFDSRIVHVHHFSHFHLPMAYPKQTYTRAHV